MKKIPVLLFCSLSLAFYNCKNSNTQPSTPPSVNVVSTSDNAAMGSIGNAKVAYINMDSLKEKYTFYKQQEAVFNQKNTALANSYESKARQWQSDMIAFQQKAQGGTVAPAQLQQEEQSLAKRQNAIAEERDRKAKELLDETQKFNETLQKKLNEVLAQLQKDKGYDYVMSHVSGGGSPLLYVNPKLDITNEVVAVLNAEKK